MPVHEDFASFPAAIVSRPGVLNLCDFLTHVVGSFSGRFFFQKKLELGECLGKTILMLKGPRRDIVHHSEVLVLNGVDTLRA